MSKEKPDRAIPNCIVEFSQTHINTRFLSHIDNFGSPPYAMIHLEIFISCLHCGLTNLSSKRLFDSVHRLQIRLNLPSATNCWPHLRQVRLIRWGLGNSGFLIYPIAISSFLVHKPPFFGNKKPSHPFTSATRLSLDPYFVFAIAY